MLVFGDIYKQKYTKLTTDLQIEIYKIKNLVERKKIVFEISFGDLSLLRNHRSINKLILLNTLETVCIRFL